MARQQSEKSARLTNLFHENIMLNELDRQMVRMLAPARRGDRGDDVFLRPERCRIFA